MTESLKLGPRVQAFKEVNDLNNLTLGPSLGDSITKVWPEIERLSHIFAVTPFMCVHIHGGLDNGNFGMGLRASCVCYLIPNGEDEVKWFQKKFDPFLL